MNTPENESNNPPRWRRRKDERPAEILEAAMQVFIERGFTSTKLEDVARRAGVTKGTVYLYFNSKEDLFKAVIREAVIPNIVVGEQMVAEHSGDARELLAVMTRDLWGRLQRSKTPGIAKLMIAEAANFPDLAQFYVDEIVLRVRRMFTQAVELGIKQGVFREVRPEFITREMVLPIHFFSIWNSSLHLYEREPFDADAFIEEHIRIVLRGIAK